MLKMFKKTQAIFKITEMLTSMWNYMGEKLFIYLCVLCLSVSERNRKTDRLHVGRTRLVCMHVCRHRVTQARVCKVCIRCVCVCQISVWKFTEVEVFKMF